MPKNTITLLVFDNTGQEKWIAKEMINIKTFQWCD